MKRFLLTAALFATSGLALAQTPCDAGFAGIYPCDGYDLVSHISWTALGATNANDSWGWTDPTDGTEYAIVGLDNGTAFIDISDPVNPVFVGKLPTHTAPSLWRDVKTYGNYAFVVSEASGHGMQVFDLMRLGAVTSAPETFTEDAHYAGFGDAHNLVINEEQGYAYGVGTGTFQGGPHFVDISDPLNPIFVGGYSSGDYSHDGQVVSYNGPDADYAGSEIYIGSNENEVVIADITDKSNPVTISTMSYSNTAYTHQGWFTEDQKYFILGDEIDELNFGFNTRNIIFDLTDLDNPQLSFEYYGPTAATDHNLYTKGDVMYLANYTAGMRVVDISDIDNGNFTETGFFDVFPNGNGAGYDGAWNVYPYFESGNILISALWYGTPSYNGGMFIVRPSGLLSTEENALSTIAIFPNPASNQLQIDAGTTEINKIQITDISAKTLFTQEGYANTKATLDLSSFSNGIYFVTINDKTTKKIIKQ